MPGWRMGMLASNAQFVQWILKVKSNIDSGTFRAMQLAAATSLEQQCGMTATTRITAVAVNWQEKLCKYLGLHLRRKPGRHVPLGQIPTAVQ